MTENSVVISAFGYLDRTGLGGTGTSGVNLETTSGDWRDVSRLAFSQNPYEHFGRLDPVCKYALAATEMLALPRPIQDHKNADMGIVMGTEFGCYSIDADFLKSMAGPTGGKPLYFIYTLPNIAMGEIAIRHAITGMNLCVMAGPESGLLALWQAYHLVAGDEAPCCICLAADAVSSWAAAYLPDPEMRTRAENGFAYTFLMENEAYSIRHGRQVLARLAVEDTTGPAGPETRPVYSSPYLSTLCRFLRHDPPSDNGPLAIPAPEAMKMHRLMSVHKGEWLMDSLPLAGARELGKK